MIAAARGQSGEEIVKIALALCVCMALKKEKFIFPSTTEAILFYCAAQLWSRHGRNMHTTFYKTSNAKNSPIIFLKILIIGAQFSLNLIIGGIYSNIIYSKQLLTMEFSFKSANYNFSCHTITLFQSHIFF
jgi:hypothetical protein